ncbi:hypothetical protein MMPV_007980 [Pyropia vietnamensis]
MAGGGAPSRRDRRVHGTTALPLSVVSAPVTPSAAVVPMRALAKRPRLTTLPPTPSALLPQSALAARLAVLTPAQLTDTLLRMASSMPGGEEALIQELPPPDMNATAAALTALNDDIVAHLPRRGGVPLFNEVAYRTVSTRVLNFRRELTARAVALERASAWTSCLEYCRTARAVVTEAVVWDTPHHNRWRGTVDGCLRRLAVKAATRIVEDGCLDMDGVELWMDLVDEYGEECPEVVDILEGAIARQTEGPR